jgi:acyl-CoA dehydrogenase
MSSLEEFCA